MGFLSGLFEKKTCAICGGEIGLLGNRKLDDGNLCKDCAHKLSPFFSERRHSTVEQIREQLEYRAENKKRVDSFNVTHTLGGTSSWKVLIDEAAKCFIVTNSGSSWRNGNPDVIDFSQLTGCETYVDEDRTEVMREDQDGNRVSYNPPKYDYDYDFNVKIYVNSPYFSEIKFQVNSFSVDKKMSSEYRDAERQMNAIREALEAARIGQNTVPEPEAPKMAVKCPACGATTMPDARGCCEFCGSALN